LNLLIFPRRIINFIADGLPSHWQKSCSICICCLFLCFRSSPLLIWFWWGRWFESHECMLEKWIRSNIDFWFRLTDSIVVKQLINRTWSVQNTPPTNAQ
jgi:hypothetical protein